MSYQAWVYRVNKPARLCLSAETYQQALADGWSDAPVVATPTPAVVPQPTEATIGDVTPDAGVLPVEAEMTVTPEPDEPDPEPVPIRRRRGRPPRKAKVYAHGQT